MKSVLLTSVLALAAFSFANLATPIANAADKANKKKKTVDEAVFKKLDKDGDSKLTKDEFSKVLAEVGKKKPVDAAKLEKKTSKLGGKIDEQFTKLDENKDSSLSLDEFKKFNPKELKAK
jgi:Ca2+-binding EF-hand superfamily protein